MLVDFPAMLFKLIQVPAAPPKPTSYTIYVQQTPHSMCKCSRRAGRHVV